MSELAISHGHAEPNPLNIDLLTRTICKGASADELALFVQICKKTGLDPFSRQIFAVKRWDRKAGCEVMQPQVSIDGFRLVAQRSGEYAGQTPVQWCGEDGEWRDVWLSKSHPVAARVGVYRRGFAEACFAVALWSEYCPIGKDGKPSGMWPRMPALMLAKCAEALALRKAFPAELSGLYTSEEMEQSESSLPVPAPAPKPVKALPAPAAPTREERRADTEALLSPVPQAERAPEPPAPAAPAPRGGGTLTLVARGWQASAVKRPNGTAIYRVDVDGCDAPFAVLDPDLMHSLEAESAFGHTIEVRWKLTAEGKRVITGVENA